MTNINTSPRKPLLALALSIMLPGLGQVYNGQLNRGIFIFLAFVFITLPFITFVALILPAVWLFPLLVLSLVATLGLYAYSMWDAWRVARRLSDFSPYPWQQPAVYVALLLFAYLSVIGSATQYVRGQLVEAFRIPSDSMSPNVLRGDYLFADKRVNCPGCKRQIKHGDIAIFVYPNNRTRLYIKRIIGLPGDEIRIQSHEVFVNGKSLKTSTTQLPSSKLNDDEKYLYERGHAVDYPVLWDETIEASDFTMTVPAGKVFVLGDNRDKTTDSRKFGTVPLMDVVGLARQVWFSYSPETGIRWSRLGMVLK